MTEEDGGKGGCEGGRARDPPLCPGPQHLPKGAERPKGGSQGRGVEGIGRGGEIAPGGGGWEASSRERWPCSSRSPEAPAGTEGQSPNSPVGDEAGGKVRVVVYTGAQNNSAGKAMILPSTWQEFLTLAARKLGLARVDSVETADGDAVEALEEILPGDRLRVTLRNKNDTPPCVSTLAGTLVDPSEFGRALAASAMRPPNGCAGPRARATMPAGAGGGRSSDVGARGFKVARSKGPGGAGDPLLDQGMEDISQALSGILDSEEDSERGSEGVDGPGGDGGGGGGMPQQAHLGGGGGGWGHDEDQRPPGADAPFIFLPNQQRPPHPMCPPNMMLPPMHRFMDPKQQQQPVQMHPFQDIQQQQQQPPMMPPIHHFQDHQQQQQHQAFRMHAFPNNPLPPQPQQHPAMMAQPPMMMPPAPQASGLFDQPKMPPPQPMSSRAKRQEQAQMAIAQLRQQAMVLTAKAGYAQQQGCGQSPAASSLKRSHEQAHFSPLVQVLRDSMVRTGVPDMPIDAIERDLMALLGLDWKARLSLHNTSDYIREAANAGLVDVHHEAPGAAPTVSVRGTRTFGVVKWVKESYGFIQSANHVEDIFYHASEVKASRPLEAKDEVEFLVVRNPFTGKLNATQIHLIRPWKAFPPTAGGEAGPGGAMAMMGGRKAPDNDSVSLAAIALAVSPPSLDAEPHQPMQRQATQPSPMDEALHDLVGRMTAMGFSPEQIEENVRQYTTSRSDDSLSDEQFHVDSSQTALNDSNKEPWLYKTKICKFWPGCPRGNKCWFAHGDDEVRKPNSAAYMLTEHGEGDRSGHSELDDNSNSSDFGSFGGLSDVPNLLGTVGAAEFQPGSSYGPGRGFNSAPGFQTPPPTAQQQGSMGNPNDILLGPRSFDGGVAGAGYMPDFESAFASSGSSSAFHGEANGDGFFGPCPPGEEALQTTASSSSNSSANATSPADEIPWGQLGV